MGLLDLHTQAHTCSIHGGIENQSPNIAAPAHLYQEQHLSLLLAHPGVLLSRKDGS